MGGVAGAIPPDELMLIAQLIPGNQFAVVTGLADFRGRDIFKVTDQEIKRWVPSPKRRQALNLCDQVEIDL